MALLKNITQPDGVITSYHRILYIHSEVNVHTSIAVLSYINEETRNGDDVSKTDNRPYRKAVTYQLSYKENLTIEDAYTLLKTLPQYVEAEDC